MAEILIDHLREPRRRQERDHMLLELIIHVSQPLQSNQVGIIRQSQTLRGLCVTYHGIVKHLGVHRIAKIGLLTKKTSNMVANHLMLGLTLLGSAKCTSTLLSNQQAILNQIIHCMTQRDTTYPILVTELRLGRQLFA